jgi:hypothetical protein
MKSKSMFWVAAIAVALSFPAAAQASFTESRSGAIADRLSVHDRSASKSGETGTDGATTSRRRPPRLMTVTRARNEARRSALDIYLDPTFTFDAYGTGTCRRINRSRVTCYTWVSEDIYDDYGYYFDTMLCDWMTTSYYTRWRSFGRSTSSPECVWLSEV